MRRLCITVVMVSSLLIATPPVNAEAIAGHQKTARDGAVPALVATWSAPSMRRSTYGRTTYGRTTYGRTTYGRTTYGRTTYGRT